RGVTHRDLKPSNVMVTKSGVKVLDFGLAKSVGDESLSGTGAIMGTPRYMAPEQASGQPADPRTDIFAFGLVFHEMVTGKMPAPGKSLLDGFGERLAHLVERCLVPEPENRWQSAADVKSELEWAANASLSHVVPRRERLLWTVLALVISV